MSRDENCITFPMIANYPSLSVYREIISVYFFFVLFALSIVVRHRCTLCSVRDVFCVLILFVIHVPYFAIKWYFAKQTVIPTDFSHFFCHSSTVAVFACLLNNTGTHFELVVGNVYFVCVSALVVQTNPMIVINFVHQSNNPFHILY